MSRPQRTCKSRYAKTESNELSADDVIEVPPTAQVCQQAEKTSKKCNQNVMQTGQTSKQRAQAKYRENHRDSIRIRDRKYSKKYRSQMTEEQRERTKELTRKRAQAYRKRKIAANQEKAKMQVTCTRKTAKEKELQREK